MNLGLEKKPERKKFSYSESGPY